MGQKRAPSVTKSCNLGNAHQYAAKKLTITSIYTNTRTHLRAITR